MVPCPEGVEIEDFQHLILLDLNFETFRVLAEEIGDEKAVEIFKPHMRNSGTALIINAQKHLGLMITDIDSLNITWIFITQALWRAPPGRLVITAKGTEWHNPQGCILSGAPFSLRRMVCDDDVRLGILMAYPEYEMSRTCLDKGDCECASILFNKADPSIDWRNRGRKDTPIPSPIFDKVKLNQFGILALGELWLFPTQALIEWRGPGAIEKLKDVMKPLGRKWGRELSRVTGKHGNDICSVFSVVDTYNSIMGQEGRTVYSSSDRHETEITICPFSVTPAEMGAQCGDAIGEQCEAFCNGLCEAVSPDFELRFTSRMCASGQNCHRVIRKKLSARVILDKA
jgi:hypothetical protein